MKAPDYLEAARVPYTLRPQTFGLWTVERRQANKILKASNLFDVGWRDYTLLFHLTEATMHQPPGDIVMEDSRPELERHLPIWLAAGGRVLVTGLGLGCVLRGLLVNPRVEHVDVVEIDDRILRVIGAEFAHNPRVRLHHADALTYEFPPDAKWDYAWHDLWCDGTPGALHLIHGELLHRYRKRCERQGAWQFPRAIKRVWPRPLLGGSRRPPEPCRV